jgi:hypothetical protein
MLFPRSHDWTRAQRGIIAAVVVAALVCLASIVYVYERYYRGPTEAVLFGTWEEPGEDGRVRYALKPDHTFEVIDPDAPYGPLIFAHGRWYAGGKFIYLRFHVEDSLDRELMIWRIDNISPNELRVRIARKGFVHTYKRVAVDSPNASNQSLQPTAGWRDAHFNFMKQLSILAKLAPASGG